MKNVIAICSLPNQYKNLFVETRHTEKLPACPEEFERCYLGSKLVIPCFVSVKSYPIGSHLEEVNFGGFMSEDYGFSDELDLAIQQLSDGRFLLGWI